MAMNKDSVALRLFDEQRHRRFGTTNPERMSLPHWEWMVRNEMNPYQALEHFGAELDIPNGPDWCFSQREGTSTTELADGRTIYVGGEYEDWYDEEFCIYNDVIVRGPGDEVEIFGYPRSVFPPTDFHSATLIGSQLVLIGNLGYQEERRPGDTPVFVLNTESYQMDQWETTGNCPGWIFKHSASLDSDENAVVIRGGQIYRGKPQPHEVVPNMHQFQLRIADRSWRRVP